MLANPFFYSTVALAVLGAYSFKKNITSGRVLRAQVGLDWKKYIKPLFSK